MEIDGFRGRLITADHADYDTARAVWNGAVDRRPRLIARCSGTADVAAAVRFARDHDVEIAVRGGGHNVAGTAVGDDGIVIDLSAMRAVCVDPAGRTARVQGGALWGDVDHETQTHGLATTGGIVGHTGVAGLTLGGGIGFLMRKHGLAVDNLLAAEVVTAEGSIVRASADEHPDLFWALRGGSGHAVRAGNPGSCRERRIQCVEHLHASQRSMDGWLLRHPGAAREGACRPFRSSGQGVRGRDDQGDRSL
ncbi:MAG: FAD-dependent oxidoreductase [Steroidobacteraceae bacterium]